MKNRKPKYETGPPTTHHLCTGTIQGNAHLHSRVVIRRQALAEFKLRQTEDAIVALTAALADERRHKRDLQAEILGLIAVLGARGGKLD